MPGWHLCAWHQLGKPMAFIPKHDPTPKKQNTSNNATATAGSPKKPRAARQTTARAVVVLVRALGPARCQSWKSCCSTDASQRKNTEAAVLSLAAEVCQRYRLIAAPWWTSWLRPVAKTGGEDWRAVAEKEGSCCEFQSLLVSRRI